jgi:hypothetical protein
MRVQAGHVPQASALSTRAQFSACANAVAVSRLPTPSGPAKMRLGGSACRATARESNSTTGRCPVMEENGIHRSIYQKRLVEEAKGV